MMVRPKTKLLKASEQLPVSVNRSSAETLQAQIFHQMQELIVCGHLRPGTVLPSFRALAAQIQVSRNTVILAYQRLVSEGYLKTRSGVGTFVTPSLPEKALSIHQGTLGESEKEELLARRHPLLFHGRLHEVYSDRRTRPGIDFFVGRPDERTFPARIWGRLLRQKLEQAGAGMTEYGNPAGLFELRRAIASHLGPARGIKVDPDRIIVVTGIQEALNLLARLLVASETQVAIEAPCYQGAAFVFEGARASITPVPVDKNGLDVALLPDGPVSVIYVTPSHQYPLGGTLSLDRRIKLLEWAWNSGAYIIEDDYDSDFRYHGSPLFSLAGLDRHESVIYLGTFSKSIGPGIRVGYMVAPSSLVEPLVALKGLLNNCNPWLEQAVLAEFLESGAFNRHLRRIRQLYLSRRDTVIAALKEQFGDVAVSGTEGGMHITWTLPAAAPDANRLSRLARKEGVGIYPLEHGAASFMSCREQCERMMMIGFSSVPEKNIRKGISIVARVIEAEAKRSRSSRVSEPMG